MRHSVNRSRSFALAFAFLFNSSTPALAQSGLDRTTLRHAQSVDTGLEQEIGHQLRTGLEAEGAAPAWVWSAIPGEIPLNQRADLLLAAKANTHGAFALGKAVVVAKHGKMNPIPETFQELSAFVKETLLHIGSASTPPEIHLDHSSPFLAKDGSTHVIDWAENNVRFVVVDDDGNGFLADQGVAGTDSHLAVVAYAGWHPYPGWEKGMSHGMIDAIRRGMRARLQNQPLKADELPGPPSVYLSKAQVQAFMKGEENGQRAFAIKLAHEIKDILRQGRHEDEAPEATALVNDFITQTMRAIGETKREREEATREREAGRLFKLHVTADLSRVLVLPGRADAHRQGILRAAGAYLRQAQSDGLIYGFNVFLFRQGRLMVVDLDHRLGKNSPQAETLAHQAILAGLREADKLGVLHPADGVHLLDQIPSRQRAILNFRKGENDLTLRETEPIMTAQAIGLGMGAFNRAIWRLLVGDVVHLQAIGGDRGFRVVVANLNDIRQGKPKYRRYVFDTPGLHDDKLKEIIRKIDNGSLTEEDLQNETAQNLHQLHRLIGAMDEYAVETVYALPGSAFGRTDEPMIRVHLHEDPVAEFREQKGSWATGSFQKVLSMPYLAPNARQTRWVGMLPVTWEEAEDLSLLERQGWPIEELGFVTAWAWTYNDNGVDRGEPPQSDVFGKNDQTQITREEFRDFLPQWAVIGDFEPRLTAEEASRRAHHAAAAFPSAAAAPEPAASGDLPLAAEPPLAKWAPIPNLKKERDPVVDRFYGPGHLVLSFAKADIGGKSGHDRPSLVQMSAIRAKLERARREGLILDYTVYFVGDDIQVALLHERGVHDKAVQELIWQAYNFGYWVSLKLGIGLYGPGQDIKISKFFAQHPVEQHANLARADVEVLSEILEQGMNGQIEAPTARFGEELRTASAWARDHFSQIEQALNAWEEGVSQGTFASENPGVGNVTGMGIGWFDYPVVDEEPILLLGLDKSGGGGINVRFKKALDLALQAADLSPEDLVEMWDVEENRRIILKFGEHNDAIQEMLAKPNKYNIKRVGIVRSGKIAAWFSLEILAKTALGYVGKDDPIYGLAWPIARHLLETFSREELAIIAQLGNEAGSHNFANVFRAWWESFPGERSNPVAVGIVFRVVGNKILTEDLGSKPEFAKGRRAAERFNQKFAEIQGEFAPLVANRVQIEPSYSRAQLLAHADEHPTDWADSPERYTMASGLEEARGLQRPILLITEAASAVATAGTEGVLTIAAADTTITAKLLIERGVPASRIIGLLWAGLEEKDYHSVSPQISAFFAEDPTVAGWQERVAQGLSRRAGREIDILVVKDAVTLAAGLERLGLPSSTIESALQLRAGVEQDLSQGV